MRFFLALVLVAAAVPAGAEPLPAAWQNWHYFRPLELEATPEQRLVYATLPMEVFGHAQRTMADLRVNDERGQEVPYMLFVRKTQRRRNWLTPRLTDIGYVPGEYTHLVVDTGEDGRLHNRIELDVDERQFFAWVEVAVSEDGKSWRIVRERAPIYRFPEEAAASLTIAYPGTRARWIRLRILTEERLQVDKCRVAQEVVEEARYIDWPLKLERMTGEGSDRNLWQIDSGVEHLPVSAVRFEAGEVEFHRPVRVRTSGDGSTWRDVGQGDVFRYRAPDPDAPEKEKLHASLRVEFAEARGRYWRVEVLDRDDRPVEGLRPVLQSNPYRVVLVVLSPERARTYRLLYGNPLVRPPHYDLRHLTVPAELERARPGTLGEEMANEAYVSPEPWTERHPAVLYVALVIAVMLLGGLALRSLRASV